MLEDETLMNSARRRGAEPLLSIAIVAALSAGLGSCSESISNVSVPSSAELTRGYDDTLTAKERKDAIAELQKDQAKAKAAKH